MSNWLIIAGMLAVAFSYKCYVETKEVRHLSKMTPQEKLIEIQNKNFFEN
jgi:hypothetical protein